MKKLNSKIRIMLSVVSADRNPCLIQLGELFESYEISGELPEKGYVIVCGEPLPLVPINVWDGIAEGYYIVVKK